VNTSRRIHRACLRACLIAGLLWALGPAGVLAQGPQPAGQVLINELLASNTDTYLDPQGQADDWVELYNPGDTPVDVGGMYLTDDLTLPTKWQFPTDDEALTTIPPQGYLVVWADDDVADAGLHAGFKLDAGGEAVGLFDRDGVTLIDSVVFGPQTAGVSYGRHVGTADVPHARHGQFPHFVRGRRREA
jgi:hypothetical protein